MSAATAGSSSDSAESQPFYVNSPFGIVLAHNGNLTNTEQLQEEMFRQDLRHINTNSDSEVLLNVLAHELQDTAEGFGQPIRQVFEPFFRMRRELPSPFDAKPQYRLSIEDHLWYWLYLPIAKVADTLTRVVTLLQRGRISVYLMYSFVTLLVLLLFVR